MKWNLRDFNTALSKPVAGLPPLILVYGDDSGAVRSSAQKLLEHSGIDLGDPFAADRVDITELQAEPGRLLESAGTISLLGGLKVIRVEGFNGDSGKAQQDALTEAVKSCLNATLQEVLIIITAPRLGKETALARAVEKAKNAAALRCFQESIRDLGAHIQKVMSQHGKNITAEAKALLIENLGADQDITRQELDKLLTYVGDAPSVTLEDIVVCLADAPAANAFKLCDAIGQRDPIQVDMLLTLLMQEGEDPNMLFSLTVRHLRRLLEVRTSMDSGKDPQTALRGLKPPVMFGQDMFLAQVRRYPLPRLQHVVSRAIQAQYQTRDLALPPEQHLRRTMLALSV